MKHKVMFGPAGSPVNYKGAAYKAPKYIKEEGLDSYEYQSPYGVRIGEKSAKILKEESEKHDILISMHGPYYINLCSKEEEKIKKKPQPFNCNSTCRRMDGCIQISVPSRFLFK